MSLALRLVYGGILCTVACCTADALPRDDVMSNAYRCSSIADSRVWLDCYYGSAQPVRGSLGMPPVTENQSRLAASPPTGGVLRDVTARGQVMAAAARCYAVIDDKGWLDCYYSSAETLRSVLGLAPFQTPRAVDTTTPPAMARSKINTGQGTLVRPSKATGRIVSRMTSFDFDWNKIFTVTLANGQTWRQREGDTTYAHWKGQPGDYLVTITKGALGSFNLEVKGGHSTFKVERIK